MGHFPSVPVGMVSVYKVLSCVGVALWQIGLGIHDSIRIDRLVLSIRNRSLEKPLEPVFVNVVLINLFFLAVADCLIPRMILSAAEHIPLYPSTPLVMYYIMWIIPVYLLSFFVNTINFASLAEVIRPTRMTGSGLEHLIVEKIGSIGIKVCLTLQMVLLAQVPFLGRPLGFVYASWYWSYSCFEYRWINDGIPLTNRMGHFEVRWPYFFGFGIFVELVYELLPFFIGAGLTGFIFALMIALAGLAPERNQFIVRISVFKQAERMTDACFEKYGSVMDSLRNTYSRYLEAKAHLLNVLHDKNKLGTVIAILLLVIIVFAAAVAKFWRDDPEVEI